MSEDPYERRLKYRREHLTLSGQSGCSLLDRLPWWVVLVGVVAAYVGLQLLILRLV